MQTEPQPAVCRGDFPKASWIHIRCQFGPETVAVGVIAELKWHKQMRRQWIDLNP